jgi:hypothetical protein
VVDTDDRHVPGGQTPCGTRLPPGCGLPRRRPSCWSHSG